jgi:uncharacterized protein (TIGR02646 family)
MRRVYRPALPAATAAYLARRQTHADARAELGTLAVDEHWKTSRQTQRMQQVLHTLQGMAGPRHRCMYCLDSEGADIEHFWPKAPYARRIYHWTNLLLCCTVCGRLKGNRFPLRAGRPQLVDPSQENPWDHLDFDPVTGNLSARYLPAASGWSAKGQATVNLLQLDRREAVAQGYQATLRRLAAHVRAALAAPAVDVAVLCGHLQADDDHGLLGWCFSPRGAQVGPFSELLARHPNVWRRCKRRLST